MIHRFARPAARLALVAATMLAAGGCCRCWWPSPSASASSSSTSSGIFGFGFGGGGGAGGAGGGAGLGGAGGGGGGAATSPGPRTPPGPVPAESLSTTTFAPDPRVPLHGALMTPPADYEYPLLSGNKSGKGLRFVPHSAASAASMFNGDIVVEANTGIWSHDAATFARKARIVAPPVLVMAASPDGHHLAYARGTDDRSAVDLNVISYPDGKSVGSIHGVDGPRRLRFSPDGKRLVVASRSAETVTLVDIAAKSARRYDTDDDVNDAIALPGPGDLVAYANDGDEAALYSMATKKKLFSTVSSMREWKGVVLDPLLRMKGRVFSFLRDQNAVAFDPLGGVFFAGGDDNVVWRFHDAIKTPRMDPPIELGGNVEEILCTHKPAPGQTEASAVVALDTLAVHVLTPDGKVQASLGPLQWSISSSPIRIALTPDDDVLAVMGGTLSRFKPTGATVEASSEYPRFLLGWRFNPTEKDTVIAAGDGPTILHYVAHTAETPDVATTIVASIDIRGTQLGAFASGARLLAGASPGGRLRLVYYVPSAGAPEAPLDIPDAAPPAQLVRRKDGLVLGMLDTEGYILEVTEKPRGAKPIGHVKGPLRGSEILSWDDAGRKWKIADLTGKTTPIDPP